MTYKTHTAMAVSVSFLPILLPDNLNFIKNIPVELFPWILVTVFISSLFPDLDEPRSYLSRKFPWRYFSLILSKFVEHRGVTHRFFASILYGLLFFLFLLISGLYHKYWILAVFAFIGYFSHLLGDGFTVSGLRRFYYPLSRKTVWFLPPFLRFKTGSFTENIWLLFFSLLGLIEVLMYLKEVGVR